VPSGLPSVFFRALGKKLICRVRKKNTRQGKKKTLSKEALCRVFFFTLGKEASLPSVFLTLDKEALCRVFFSKHILKQ